MIEVGIVGGTGYTGAELLRLFADHPRARVRLLTSRQEAGRDVAEVFPQLRGRVDLKFSVPDPGALAQCQAVFFATPHGTAMQMAPELLKRGVKVIDLSADFRLKDVATFTRWYRMDHACPDWLEKAVYGLPEMERKSIVGAQLVAAPGCYPTSVQLALLPLLEAGVIDAGAIIADCKSGVSGAGRELKATSLFCEAAESVRAYGVDGHRHQPEIEQGLARAAGKPVGLTFVPHLMPMNRGILATVYATLTKDIDAQALFDKRYRGEPFVEVMPPGSSPETRSVRGANHCRLAVHRRGNRLIVLSAIDNLVKGASGQALQCFNLMHGLPETAGLTQTALWP